VILLPRRDDVGASIAFADHHFCAFGCAKRRSDIAAEPSRSEAGGGGGWGQGPLLARNNCLAGGWRFDADRLNSAMKAYLISLIECEKATQYSKARVGITRRFPLPDPHGRKWATVGSAHIMRSYPKDAGKQRMGRDDERGDGRLCSMVREKTGEVGRPTRAD
jgi:hypothetical protein